MGQPEVDAAVSSVVRDLLRCEDAARQLLTEQPGDGTLQLVHGELQDIARFAAADGPGGRPAVESAALDVAIQVRACFDMLQAWAGRRRESSHAAAPLAHALLLAAAATGRLARRLTTEAERALLADGLAELRQAAAEQADEELAVAVAGTLRLFERALPAPVQSCDN